MTKQEYNGWHNYETWVVALWLDNEEGSSDYCRELAEDMVKQHGDRDGAKSAFADVLKDQYEEAMPKVEGVFADLLNAAMSEVNWYEIAGHYVDEVEVEEPVPA